jgi:hypothetical protein
VSSSPAGSAGLVFYPDGKISTKNKKVRQCFNKTSGSTGGTNGFFKAGNKNQALNIHNVLGFNPR